MNTSYIRYKDFIINTKTLNYQSLLSGESLARLNNLHQICEAHEKAFYYLHFGQQRVSGNWKDKIRDYLAVSGVEEKRAKQITASAYLNNPENYDKFKDEIITQFNNEFRGQLSLFNKPLEDSIDSTIHKIYATFQTRSNSGSLKITKKGYSGYGANTLSGLILEMAEGILDTTKHSTLGRGKRWEVRADYVVDGIGLEETKRGLREKNNSVIMDSQFHIGDFNLSNIREDKVWDTLIIVLADIFVRILQDAEATSGTTLKFYRKVLDSFDLLVIEYLLQRLTDSIGNDEIFYFASTKHILLGSEFIEGIKNYSMLKVTGQAKITNKITFDKLNEMGLNELVQSLQAEGAQIGMNFQNKKLVLHEFAIKKLKHGAFLNQGKFNLWYGKY